ncbi:50S ribosomal protein L29 [Candidatus Babeliales bacterium]|nr:50S ribosomal protein L29 [Candidatus Babeliales bacterium]
MKKDEMKKMDSNSLKKEVEKLKKELFNLRLNIAIGDVKDYSQFKKIRNDIARCLTFLNQTMKISGVKHNDQKD